MIVQYKPAKYTILHYFNYQYFDVFYMFQTPGFIFMKTVVCTVIYVEDIEKLKFKILI